MIKFKPLSYFNNDWSLQSGIYLHGKIAKKYNTDIVVMNDDVYSDRISEFYYEGKALPITFIDIPEGKHLCEVYNTPCVLFTWKRFWISKGGRVIDPKYEGPYDIWLRQLGLIVDLSDKEGIAEATIEFENKNYII